METYSSNINYSFLQDLGPFKLLDADNSLKGKTIYSYSNTDTATRFGSTEEFGKKHIIGSSSAIGL